MPTVRTLARSFSSGELTPELFGRVDLNKFQSGVAVARNFVILPHGPARNRTGTQFVKEVGNSAKKTRLIPFSYTNTQTFAIELGAGFIRWHTQGGTLLAGSVPAYNGATAYNKGDMASSGGINYYCIAATTGNAPPNATYWYAMPADGTYEIPNSYAEADLFDIHYTQSADVLTLVHPSYAPLELRRYGATNWQLAAISFAPTITAPTGVTATPTGSGGTPITQQYVVSAVSSTNNLEQSLQSSSASCSIDLTVAGNYVTVGWTAVSGAQRYNVYKYANGLYGYIGQASGTSFKDQNITPDMSQTPPIVDSTLSGGAGYYPAAVGYFQQRRVFAGWTASPQSVVATRSGTESNVCYHIPSIADDRLAFRIAAREASAIRHIVPVQSVILLTATNEFRLTSTDGGAVTATTALVSPQAYVGANNVQPVVVGSGVLYAQSRGGRVREMSYNWQAQSYLTNDISLMAPHLFDYFNITDMTFCRAPQPILWCVNDQGALLGMTYVPEQQISAWHRHDTTNGAFESCCAVTENGEDMLYLVVRRTINGSTKRYVERLASRNFATQADNFFVDCGATYSGAATTTISGLNWLEGQTVSVLGDGAVMPQAVVTGGTITLQQAVSKAQVGLPITADLQTLPFVYAATDFGHGRFKNINKAFLRVVNSSGVFAGPDFNNLVQYAQRTVEPYGSPPAFVTNEIEIVLDTEWGTSGQLCVRQSDPLPLTIVSVTLDVAVGG